MKQILIVDDEKHIGSLLQDFLEESGYAVEVRLSLGEARAALFNGLLPDLIVLDVMLPDGNGLEYLKELRASPTTEGIPVVIISAHRVDTQDRIQGFNEGADDYLTKPFDLQEFKLRLERLFKRVSRISAPPAVPPEATVPVTPSPPPAVTSFEEALKNVIQKKTPSPSVLPRPSLGAISGVVSPETNAKKEPVLKRMATLILDPWRFFSERHANDWMLGAGAVGLFSLALGLQNGFDGGGAATGVISVLGIAAISYAVAAALAWGLQWGWGLRQKRLLFREVFTLATLSFAPLALSALLGVVYVVVAKGRFGDFTAGLQLLFPTQSSTTLLGFVLRHLDVFEWWAVGLFLLGFRRVKKT